MPDLAKLDAAAIKEYEIALNRALTEPSRLEALYGSEFWNRPQLVRLQTLVDTAKMVLGTRGSAIIVVTDKRQQAVVSTDLVENHNDDLDGSMCKFVVSEKHPFGVESALSHSLVCTNKAVTQKGIRAYLGVPLAMETGMVLGSFCVWETYEREWDESDVLVLANFAAIAVALERRVAD